MDVPRHAETLIVGGGIVGSAVAYFLARDGGRGIVVLEPDGGYARASTPRSASAIRTQFHLGVNVAMSRYGHEFFGRATEHLSLGGERVDIAFEDCPYLVLSAPEGVPRLRAAFERQVEHGADVAFLAPEELRARVPWLKLEGLGAATLGLSGEGWFEPLPALLALRRKAEELGVTYVAARAAAFETSGGRIERVALEDGRWLDVGDVVNAAGARAARVAALAGVALPVEARKRTAFVFRAERPPAGFTNLVDPTVAGRGLYARPYRGDLMAVTSPAPAADPDTEDLEPDLGLFDEVVRPALARRVRGLESVELLRAWAGHYEMNTFDQNAVLGRHPEVPNLVFACGLSGHGVMHAPAIGRGLAELLTAGAYRTLDLSPFRFERLAERAPLDDVQPSEARETAAGV